MKKIKIVIVSLAVAALAAAAGYGIWCSTLEDNVIWEDVSVNEVCIQGMTIEEANAAILEKFEKDYQDAEITVEIADEEYKTAIFPVLGLDVSEIVEEAYVLGHGKWYTRGLDAYRLKKLSPKEVSVFPTADHPEAVEEAVKETGIEKVNTVKETTVEVTETSLEIEKGVTGVSARTEELKKAILRSIENQDYEAVLACPVNMTKPKGIELQPYYDEIHKVSKSAVYDRDTDTVLPSEEGVSFSVKEAEELLLQAQEGELLTIPFTIREPEVTTEELTEKLFRDTLGSYQAAGSGTANRMSNITLACQACDGVILMPGETFSYNETVGERTAERGYKSAGVYVNGQLTDGIGGGICQVSSALFSACLYADMEIVKRYNHSGRVAYVPLGMDATVSWGGPDYQFKNNTDYPVKLSVTYINGVVNAEIFGTKDSGKRVEVSAVATGPLSAKTYRNYYDENGTLLSTVEVCTSQYRS